MNKNIILLLLLIVIALVHSTFAVIQFKAGDTIPNALQNINKKQKKDVLDACDKLKYSDIFNNKKETGKSKTNTIVEHGSIKLNLEITHVEPNNQTVHDIHALLGKSTVAHLIIDENVKSKDNHKGIEKKLCEALSESLKNSKTFTVYNNETKSH